MSRHAGVYNVTRQAGSLLRRYRKEPPSLVMHLYSAGFRLGNNLDSPLHSNDGDIKCWLDCVREQRIPNELLDVMDELTIKFYDGCLIVEVYDHRPSNPSQVLKQPKQTDPLPPNPPPGHDSASADLPNHQVTSQRVVLSPTCATLWHDIMFLNESKLAQMTGAGNPGKAAEFKWGPITEEEAVVLEAAILERTTPALCLSPSVITSRIANQMLNETTPQPAKDFKKPRKRPLNSGEKEAIRRQRERQERFMHIADEGFDQAFAPTFSRFDLIKRVRTDRPAPPTSRVMIPKPLAQNMNQDKHSRPIAPWTIAPTDLYFYGNLPSDLKDEPQPAPSTTAAPSNQLQLPTSTLPPTSPPAPTPSSSAPAPPKKGTNTKKKTTVLDETSETGSPAPSSIGPAKKLSKKAQKQLDMTPEALAAAEEKKKKAAENRRLAKERKAAAAKAQAAALKAASTTNPTSAITGPNKETTSAPSPRPPDNSIPVPNRTQANPQLTEYKNNETDGSSIPVLDSIPVLTNNNNLAVPNHKFDPNSNNSIPVPSLQIPSNQNPMNGIPVHPDLNTNINNSIPVPSFNNRPSIPVLSNSNNNNFSGQRTNVLISTTEMLPISSTSQDSIPVLPVVRNDMNSIPVPNHHHQQHQQHQHQHQSMEMSSIPVPQSDPVQQQHRWNNFTEFGILNHQQQRASEMDIRVHHNTPQVSIAPSPLSSMDIQPSLLHPHPPPPSHIILPPNQLQQPFMFPHPPNSLPDHNNNNSWN